MKTQKLTYAPSPSTHPSNPTHTTRGSGALSHASSVVVYCAFKSSADALAAQLLRAGVDAAAYHAGKNLAQRDAVQVGRRDGDAV